MLINLQNLKPVDPVTDSTRPREETDYLQSEADKYTKRIADLIMGDPCASAPGIPRRLGCGE